MSGSADLVGAIPGEGNLLSATQLGAAGVGYVNSLATGGGIGAAGSVVGGYISLVGAAGEKLGITGLKVVPVTGNLLSAGVFVRDGALAANDYVDCKIE